MAETKAYPIRLLVGGSNGFSSLLNIICERPDHSILNVSLDLTNNDKLQLLSFEDISEGKVIYEDIGVFGHDKLTKIILPKNVQLQ